MKILSLFVAILGISTLATGCATARPGNTAAAPGDTPAAKAAKQPPKTLPAPPEAIYQALVAEMAAQRGYYDVAAEYYQRLARTTKNPKIAERATRIAVFTRDDKRALESAKVWLEQEPGNLEARLLIAAVLIKQGKIDAAVEHLEKVLAEQATTPDHGFGMVTTLLASLPDSKPAIATMEQLVSKHKDDPFAQLNYSQLALRAEALNKARNAVEAALRLKPEWPNAMVLKARILQLSGDTAQSLQILDAVIKQQPNDIPLRLAYARTLISANRHADALTQFEVLLKQAPDNADVLLGASLLSIDLKDLDKAENYLAQLSKQPKRSGEASFYLGVVAEEKKDYATATQRYSAVPPGENYLSAQIRIAELMARQGDIEGARGHLRGLGFADPSQKLRIYLAEGNILYQAGQYTPAMELYDAALTEIPDNPDLLYSRALTAEKLDRLDILERDLTSIIKRQPDNAAVLNTLGYTLADRTNRYQEALGYIKRALELRPQDFAIMDSMGWIQHKLGNNEEAIRYLRKAFEQGQDPEIAAHLGEVLWVTGDQQGAKEVWQRAVKTTPDHKVLLETMRRFGQ